jgi:hypothetical protein
MVFLVEEVAERLPIRIAHDEAVVGFVNCDGRKDGLPMGKVEPIHHSILAQQVGGA